MKIVRRFKELISLEKISIEESATKAVEEELLLLIKEFCDCLAMMLGELGCTEDGHRRSIWQQTCIVSLVQN